MPSVTIDAEPEPIVVDPARTAMVVIDTQRDCLEPVGFGETRTTEVGVHATVRVSDVQQVLSALA